MGAIGGALTYLIVYNSIPFYEARSAYFDGMVGASAAVFAITVATAAYFPDYKFYLLFLGPVKIKYIAIFFIFTSFIGITGSNAGGNLAHLGGAFVGWYYARRLKTGNEIGIWVFRTMEFFKSFFVTKPKIRVSHRQTKTPGSSSSSQKSSTIDQKEIDAILDKISVGGYDSLTKEEKEKLFNASK
jgi:hypothetical protein